MSCLCLRCPLLNILFLLFYVHISLFEPDWWGRKIGNIWNNFNHTKVYTVCNAKQGNHVTCIKKEKE